MDLNGAVALVTGGNGGLGQRICHALAKQGAHVAVMCMRRAATRGRAWRES
jgi:3-oxoacyl-[acyl-carrier protein] reductase